MINLTSTQEQLKILSKKLFIRKASEDITKRLEWIVQKVELILGTFPDKLKINFVLCNDKKQVQAQYKALYGKDFNSVAFYDPGSQTIHLATDKAILDVVSHEVAHAILCQGYNPMLSVPCQEVLAQYVQTKLFEGL